MIWYNIAELEQRLKQKEISDSEIVNYLIADFILLLLMASLPGMEYQHKWMSYADALASVVITVIGIRKIFSINANADNTDFFRRFISLSFVSAVRLMVIIALIALPIAVIQMLGWRNFTFSNDTATGIDLLLGAGIAILYYVMLTRSFTRVSQSEIAQR